MKVAINGEVLDEDAARISPLDHGLMVGDGVFETLCVYDGVPFAWTRHDERLRRSAGGLGLEVPDAAALREAADAVIAANHVASGRLRITVTGGPAPLGSERGDQGPTWIVAAKESKPWPPTTDVVVVPWVRNERSAVAGFKTISYAENVRALAVAHEAGAGEAIFANTRGELCEATGSNVFVVSDGILRTPPERSGCLLGVTRALILDLAVELGLPVEEPDMSVDDLRDADEAFISSSTREVHPVAHVDGVALPVAPGPVSLRLADAFKTLVATTIDP